MRSSFQLSLHVRFTETLYLFLPYACYMFRPHSSVYYRRNNKQ
jgi:hypothetical protein